MEMHFHFTLFNKNMRDSSVTGQTHHRVFADLHPGPIFSSASDRDNLMNFNPLQV